MKKIPLTQGFYALVDDEVRRLTPMKCERLQGFPDNWSLHGLNPQGKKITLSDTQRYRGIGNAVSLPIITLLAKRLKGDDNGK